MGLKLEHINANISLEQKQVIRDLNLVIEPGSVHVLMGPNGSGKSSLAKLLLNHSDYELTSGKISIDDVDLTTADTTTRAKAGLFLANQYPPEIPGVNLANFLRLAYNSQHEEKLSIYRFRQLLKQKLQELGLGEEFMNRNLNEGFSGGEKKKCEILQLIILSPKYAILDETDSGLDVDAIRIVFTNIAKLISENKKLGVLLITHYPRIFDYINPDYVHLFKAGSIQLTGGMELAKKIDLEGYLGDYLESE